MKRSVIFLIGLFSVGVVAAQEQASRCAQTLRLAQSTYESGRLQEVPGILQGCIDGVEFSVVERTNALRLVVLSYIYLEEHDKADQAMMDILNNEHFYAPNEAVDPPEFVALFNTFRHKPVWSAGIKIGGNTSYPWNISNYYVGSTSVGQGEASQQYSFQFGLYFEKQLFGDFFGAPEIAFTNHKFSYANEALSIDENTGENFGRVESVVSQNWLDLNLLVQYAFKNSVETQFFVTLGPTVSYIVGAEGTLVSDFRGFTVTGPSVDEKDRYNPLNYSIIAGGGIKKKIGGLYLLADIRYKFGINNIIDSSNRTNIEQTFDYGYTSNDMRIQSLMINVGIMYPYFKPKKLAIK
ncbi:MAG: PorT family protein [Flammeovirgaceae bacterium]|nr:PorT family protein [Flammeovirgaceae bacterium]